MCPERAHFTEEACEARRCKVTPKDTSWKGADSGWTQVWPRAGAPVVTGLRGVLKGTRRIPEILHQDQPDPAF